MSGVDAGSGEVVFEHEHGGRNGSAMMPVMLDDQTVLLTLDDAHSTAFYLRQVGDKIEVSEAWQERSIKNTYNMPSLTDGKLVAFSTRVLTCVDPETGRAFWKSREPGDGFLITVDDHMIINTKKGSLHLAKVTEDDYEEIAGQ